MTDHVLTRVANGTGVITLDRPKALNSLSLAMVRRLTEILLAWREALMTFLANPAAMPR